MKRRRWRKMLGEMRRGITGGCELDELQGFRLYCQLRLLLRLGALPAAGGAAAAAVTAEDRSCIVRAVQLESRDLAQRREQYNNLEGWRRADAGLRQRFEDCPVVEEAEGGWQWGRHCAFCRHDRRQRLRRAAAAAPAHRRGLLGAFAYRAVHRYPARLDAMLLLLTRRFLRRTPVDVQPSSLAGLAAAMAAAHAGQLLKHWRAFSYQLDALNMLQNRTYDKTAANARICSNMRRLLYARVATPTEEEEQQGVDLSAELAEFEAATAERREESEPEEEEEQEENGLELLLPWEHDLCLFCSQPGHWSRDCPERERCFHCKELGHWSRDCPQLEERRKCFRCKQIGHWAANCPNK
ncbi:zinc knuckle domain-containing [Micractinium conductrix]|uniref:Zinc knuckle domain-containing n=1 Tax=Micractinium conductrix TaxID=554055 RepID=A0A2P6UZ67_9CHLO|nr:zinc knuckle domain-containing [Micractinium conductrix]|eukprot:PSC67094.1 zinc knuckle domain-containing [Micractinium conductrix]